VSTGGVARTRRSMYARLLRLRYVRLSALMSFLLFEGTIAVAVLLALAELVSWWAVAVLPVAVAATVKFNDVVTGALLRARRAARIASARQGARSRRSHELAAVPDREPAAARREAGVSVLNRSSDSDGYRFSRPRDMTGRHGAPNGASERRFRRSA